MGLSWRGVLLYFRGFSRIEKLLFPPRHFFFFFFFFFSSLWRRQWRAHLPFSGSGGIIKILKETQSLKYFKCKVIYLRMNMRVRKSKRVNSRLWVRRLYSHSPYFNSQDGPVQWGWASSCRRGNWSSGKISNLLEVVELLCEAGFAPKSASLLVLCYFSCSLPLFG